MQATNLHIDSRVERSLNYSCYSHAIVRMKYMQWNPGLYSGHHRGTWPTETHLELLGMSYLIVL